MGPDENVTHELFFELLERDIQKVHNFTDKKVTEIRNRLRDVAKRLNIDNNSVPGPQVCIVRAALTYVSYYFIHVYTLLNSSIPFHRFIILCYIAFGGRRRHP